MLREGANYVLSDKQLLYQAIIWWILFFFFFFFLYFKNEGFKYWMQYIITEANSEMLKAKWHIASQRDKSAKISELIYLSIHLFTINYLFEALLIFPACFFFYLRIAAFSHLDRWRLTFNGLVHTWSILEICYKILGCYSLSHSSLVFFFFWFLLLFF